MLAGGARAVSACSYGAVRAVMMHCVQLWSVACNFGALRAVMVHCVQL